MSNFADRVRYSLDEVTEIHKKPGNTIQHVLDNGDDTYSLMYHIVCEMCDYCGVESKTEGRWWDNNGFIIHPAKENPYEEREALEKEWDEEERLKAIQISKDEFDRGEYGLLEDFIAELREDQPNGD